MFLCDLSFSGFAGARAKTEITRRAQYEFLPNRMRCKRGGELLLTSLRFGSKEQLARGINVPLQFFAPEAFAVALTLQEVKGKQLVVVTLENPSDRGVRFQLELGRQSK